MMFGQPLGPELVKGYISVVLAGGCFGGLMTKRQQLCRRCFTLNNREKALIDAELCGG